MAETKALLDAVQRDRREDGDRLLRRAARGDGQAAGAARPQGRLGPGQPARAGHGRAALPAARRRRDHPVRRRAAPGRAVQAAAVQQPDLLLLDEPTNHLDAESVQWLEQHLEKYPGTVVAVTHDRYFLDNVAQWILELDRGHAYPYEGNYSTYLETKAARLKVEGAKDAKKRKRLEDELEWVRSSPRARQAKSRARLRALRGDGGRGGQEPQAGLRGDPDPAGPAPGQPGRRGQRPGQGLRRPGAVSRT